MRMPELALRLGHHMPAAAPFLPAFYGSLLAHGFTVDAALIKPRLIRNGARIVVNRDGPSRLIFTRWGNRNAPVYSFDFAPLVAHLAHCHGLRGDYERVLQAIDSEVASLAGAVDLLAA